VSELPNSTLIYPNWNAPANVRAISTTRNGGVSLDPWGQLNLGAHCGDEPSHVEQNRQLLRQMLPIDPRWLKQVHGKNVTAWNEAGNDEVEADAITSYQAGQVCAVLTADCLPVLFCNQQGTKVAAAHAGWRGLAAGVLESTVAAMNCEPSEILAWMGPAIGPKAFEVGQDVYDAFDRLSPKNSSAFSTHKDRYLADLYELARLTLLSVGVEQVSGGEYCTYTDSDNFFSYRRVGVTGRMASLIWLET
jgi:YfiH family protein